MDPILTNLSTYSGKYAPGLIAQVFRALKNQEITVLENIKGPTKFAKLKIGRGLKPYTGQFTPGNVLDYSDRTLSPEMAQFDVNIDPRKYRDSYMTESIDKNSKWFGIPEENFVWAKVLEELQDELVQYSVYKGDKTQADLARKIVDGLELKILEIIAAGRAPIATGVITDANGVAKFELMYADAMSANSEWRTKPLNLYCSYAKLDNYRNDYRTKFSVDPANWSDDNKPMYLKNSSGKCKITPVEWLNGSSRLILAPKENLVLGTDKLNDMNTINTVLDVYTVKAGICFTIGFQVIDSEAIWFNELS